MATEHDDSVQRGEPDEFACGCLPPLHDVACPTYPAEGVTDAERPRDAFGRLKLDAFTRAYLECALWSTTDESREDGGDPLDQNYSITDFTEETVLRAIRECEAFQERFGDAIDAAPPVSKSEKHTNREMAGHDFWLTRNGHGAGFWDGDWPQELGEQLTAAAKHANEVYLVVTDDGEIDDTRTDAEAEHA